MFRIKKKSYQQFSFTFCILQNCIKKNNLDKKKYLFIRIFQNIWYFSKKKCEHRRQKILIKKLLFCINNKKNSEGDEQFFSQM